MFTKIFTGIVCYIFGFAIFVGAENITFESNSKTDDGKPLILTGELLKPDGNEPFAAVVLLPGCAGVQQQNIEWAEKLVTWGYVTFQVDSFSPRGRGSICGSSNKGYYTWFLKRAQDAHDAKSYLAELSFVDKNRIAVMGWSHGAGTILASINKSTEIKNRGNPFQAAIAFYPYCYGKLEGFESPLLILIGEQDKLTPAALCKKQMVSKTSIPEVVLKIYPDAGHSFDLYKFPQDVVSDAVVQVKSFLTKHMQ